MLVRVLPDGMKHENLFPSCSANEPEDEHNDADNNDDTNHHTGVKDPFDGFTAWEDGKK
jgi:hypothetical protein